MSALYRTLLKLYPVSFRLEYGPELMRTWEDAVRERGRVGALLAALGDVVPNALAAHWTILVQDLRYTARSLRGSRGFALATILVTALGVGANVATFSVADFVLVRPLPFPEPDQLVRICSGPRIEAGWGCMNQMSAGAYRDVLTRNRSFTDVGAFARTAFNVASSGEPMRVEAASFTPNLFPLLGVRPFMGRTFDTRADESQARVIVISHSLWQSHFGGDEQIIGSSISLDGERHDVIGVMPPHFLFPVPEVQAWVPQILREEDYADRGNNPFEGVARLRTGVTFEQARADLLRIADQIVRDYPDDDPEYGFSFFMQRDAMSPRYRTILLALVGASLSMLLLTCANLANLSLARAAGRERELAVRAALGAGRERLMRQMLTESMTLALLGGIAGAVAAVAVVPLLASLVPTTMPLASSPSVDLRALAFAATFAALTGLGFGLIPALRVGGHRGFSALRDGARGSAGRQRLRTTLVAIEVAVSVVLLVSSGLLIRAIWSVQAVDSGFATANVLTLRTALASTQYDSLRRADFYQRALAGVRAIPGVQSAGYISGLPMVMTGGITLVLLPGEGDRRDGTQTASLRLASSGYFESVGISLRMGRDVSETDTPDRQLVAVVSESFARRHWPDDNPLGRTFSTRNQERTVVGVVGDVMVRGLERESEPQLYVPALQPPVPVADQYHPRDLIIRTTRAASSLLPSIREVIRRIDPQQPISNVRPLADVVGDQTAARRAQVQVLGALALLALLLAGVGIHGLLSYTVAQRDREIGVRLALGARPDGIARMVLSEGTRMAVLGVVPGVVIGYLAARAMSSMLFGVSPDDPLTFGVAAAACFVMTALGCVRPAIRAARIAPMTALRSD
ncbi:MAG: ABC transporter permease [Gemmatimonadaceae bacterium]